MIRPIKVMAAVAACVLVSACGSSGAPGPTTTTITPSSSLPTGFKLYLVHHGLAVGAPSSGRPLVTRAATGRISAGWVEPQTGFLLIDGIWDPRPANLATATAAAVKGPHLGARSVKVTVRSVSMPGARQARLVTSQTAHGPHGLPAETAVLIADEPGGAQIEVQVIAQGSGHPDLMSVIRTVRLTA